MLATPVLQNAFFNPGITAAVNLASARDVRVYGAAAAWTSSGARLQLSAGAGAYDPDTGSTVPTGGVRVTMPVFELSETGNLAVAAFAGAGGARINDTTEVHLPLGAAIGWRRALGGTRGLSVYAAPFLSYSRREGAAEESNLMFRISMGLDFGFSPAMGVTAGFETGAEASGSEPGPHSPHFGVAASYAFGRRGG